MATTGVTFEQVAAVADAMLGEGRQPTIRAVRERLDGGSPNTIQRHLVRWREGRPAASARSPEVPVEILRAIQDEIGRVSAEGRAEVEARLVQAQQEAAELAAAGQAIEAERDAAQAQAAAAEAECDRQAGRLVQLEADVQRSEAALAAERRAAEEARIELATARLAVEAQREQARQSAGEVDSLRTALTQEREARIEAERQLAAASTAREHLEGQVRDLTERERALAHELAGLRGRLDAALGESQARASELVKMATDLRGVLAAAPQGGKDDAKGEGEGADGTAAARPRGRRTPPAGG